MLIAVVILTGVGLAYVGAYIFPVTKDDVENAPPAGRINANPVMKVAAAGLIPISPLIWVVPVVETSVFASIAKLAAVPRFTAVRPDVVPPVVKLHTLLFASDLPVKLFTPVVTVAV